MTTLNKSTRPSLLLCALCALCVAFRSARCAHRRNHMKSLFCICLLIISMFTAACRDTAQPQLVVSSKFFTEQVVLAELLAQHIQARTGIPVQRKFNLGGTLLVQKAMLSGDVDLYVEYTGTALTGVLGEKPQGGSSDVYQRVREEYARRFGFEVTEPLGFANSFAMVVRAQDARNEHLANLSDIAPVAPRWRARVGYECLGRSDLYRGLV